jgi:ABC-2 type transport system ATP-binding protein
VADALAVHGLEKRYGSVHALKGVDLAVEEGELVGLLGPNGAGKSTLVKIAVGLVRPTRGGAEVVGARAGSRAARAELGYLAELFRFPGWYTADEVLGLHQRLARSEGGAAERRRLLDRVALADATDRRVDGMSKGMQQRLGIAQALVGSPRILVLDEPTSALDPAGRRVVRVLLEELRGRGVSVLLNSHLLSEIELTCGRVAVLRNGTVAAEGSIESLTAPTARYRLVATGVDERLLAAFRETGATVERVNGHFDLGARDLEHLNALVDRLRASGGRLQELTPLRSSLEDVFVGLVREDAPREGEPS